MNKMKAMFISLGILAILGLSTVYINLENQYLEGNYSLERN